MKANFALLSIVFLTACAAAEERPTSATAAARDTRLAGTWELVSTNITRGDTTLMQGGPPELRSLKILNHTHYSVLTRRADQFLRAGAGRYTLAGDTYTESIDLASNTAFVPGAVFTFRIRLDGDTWTLDGTSGRTRVQEVWRRVSQ